MSREDNMDDRFVDLHYPEITDGKPTRYNWLVKNVSGLSLGFKTDIGEFSYINAQYGVVIEDEVNVRPHCSIYSVSTIDDSSGKVLLKENCLIGNHSTILPRVTIVKNSIIGAHSLVNRDIPDDVVVFGVSAKVVKKLYE